MYKKLGTLLVLFCVFTFLFFGANVPVSAEGEVTITSVTPQTIYNDLDTQITVGGSQFVDVLRVALDDTALTDINVISDQMLTAVIPWGMAPGTYTLNIMTETGSGSLEAAVTIELGIGEWISKGPYGGHVSQILQNPDVTDIIFTVVTEVGIFRSVDHGENWEFVFATGSPIGNLAMDANNPNLLYATKTSEGLYRSLDGGDSWEAIPFPGISQIYTARAFAHPTESNVVYSTLSYSDYEYDASLDFGIYRSVNAGQTWTHISEDIPNDKKLTALDFGDGYIYAGTEDGLIYRSVDDGANWVETVVNWSGETVDHISKLKIQPGTTSLFVIPEGEGFSGPMFRCAEQENSGVISLDCAVVLVETDYFSSTDPSGDIQFNPTDKNDILIAFSKPARSTNNGVDWNVYSDFSAPFQPSSVMFDLAEAGTIFAGNMQGVFRNSTAGSYDSAWEEQVEGMTGLIPNYLAISGSQPQSVYANPSGAGLFHSADGGVNWEKLPNFTDDGESQYAANLPVAVDSANDDIVVVPTWYNFVRVSMDGGMTWTDSDAISIPGEYPGYTFAFEFLEPIPGMDHQYLAGGYFLDPESNDDHQAPAGAIYRLELAETASSWSELLVEPLLGRVRSVVFDPNNPTKIYCASYTKNDEGYAEQAALVYSEDNGASWNIITPGSGFEGYQEMATLAMSPSTGILLADAGNGIVSIDPASNIWEGYSYIPMNSGPINRLLFAPALGGTPETLYAATTQGLFESINGGGSWAYVSSDFIGVEVTALKYIPLSEIQGIVYTGIVGSLIEAAGRDAVQRSGEGLLDGGVYHLTRIFSDLYLSFIPFFSK